MVITTKPQRRPGDIVITGTESPRQLAQKQAALAGMAGMPSAEQQVAAAKAQGFIEITAPTPTKEPLPETLTREKGESAAEFRERRELDRGVPVEPIAPPPEPEPEKVEVSQELFRFFEPETTREKIERKALKGLPPKPKFEGLRKEVAKKKFEAEVFPEPFKFIIGAPEIPEPERGVERYQYFGLGAREKADPILKRITRGKLEPDPLVTGRVWGVLEPSEIKEYEKAAIKESLLGTAAFGGMVYGLVTEKKAADTKTFLREEVQRQEYVRRLVKDIGVGIKERLVTEIKKPEKIKRTKLKLTQLVEPRSEPTYIRAEKAAPYLAAVIEVGLTYGATRAISKAVAKRQIKGAKILLGTDKPIQARIVAKEALDEDILKIGTRFEGDIRGQVVTKKGRILAQVGFEDITGESEALIKRAAKQTDEVLGVGTTRATGTLKVITPKKTITKEIATVSDIRITPRVVTRKKVVTKIDEGALLTGISVDEAGRVKLLLDQKLTQTSLSRSASGQIQALDELTDITQEALTTGAKTRPGLRAKDIRSDFAIGEATQLAKRTVKEGDVYLQEVVSIIGTPKKPPKAIFIGEVVTKDFPKYYKAAPDRIGTVIVGRGGKGDLFQYLAKTQAGTKATEKAIKTVVGDITPEITKGVVEAGTRPLILADVISPIRGRKGFDLGIDKTGFAFVQVQGKLSGDVAITGITPIIGITPITRGLQVQAPSVKQAQAQAKAQKKAQKKAQDQLQRDLQGTLQSTTPFQVPAIGIGQAQAQAQAQLQIQKQLTGQLQVPPTIPITPPPPTIVTTGTGTGLGVFLPDFKIPTAFRIPKRKPPKRRKRAVRYKPSLRGLDIGPITGKAPRLVTPLEIRPFFVEKMRKKKKKKGKRKRSNQKGKK